MDDASLIRTWHKYKLGARLRSLIRKKLHFHRKVSHTGFNHTFHNAEHFSRDLLLQLFSLVCPLIQLSQYVLLMWARGVLGQITLTPSTIDRTRTTTVTKTVTQVSVSLTTSIITTATTSTATVTAPITYRETTTVVATKTATTTQTTTQTTTVPCSLVNCPKITSTGTICKSCFVAQCTTTSTVTRSCGCSSALATTTVDFGCEQPDVCNRIGCRTVYAVATPAC